MKETDLYAPVKSWLEAKGYTVYPEVCHRGTRADVVGVKEGSTIIVELKTSLSRDLIDQGLRWRSKGAATLIYVASPKRTKAVSEDVLTLLTNTGVGLITVGEECLEHVPSKVHLVNARNDISKAITTLHSEIDIEGGHSGGGYLTQYKATIIRVRKYLESRSGWVSLTDIATNCPTHYTGDVRSSLSKSLQDFEHEWCECKKINNRLHFKVKRGAKNGNK